MMNLVAASLLTTLDYQRFIEIIATTYVLQISAICKSTELLSNALANRTTGGWMSNFPFAMVSSINVSFFMLTDIPALSYGLTG